jgi:signal transduction histidine kinase
MASCCLILWRKLNVTKDHQQWFNGCHHPWLVCNEDLELIEANPAAQLLFGTDCKLKTLDQLLDKPAPAIREIIKLNHKQATQLDGLFCVGDAENKCWVTITITNLGRQQYSVFLTHAEQQQQLEQVILKENIFAAKARCYAGLLHEIGNPIAAVDGMLTEVHRLLTNPTIQQNKYFALLKYQLERIDRIRFKTALLSAHSDQSEHQLYSLNELLTGLTELLAFDKRAKTIKLALSLDSNIPAISLNRDKMTQVYLNLISNAFDACHDTTNGLIEISTKYHDGQLELVVSDNGCGMSKNIQQQVLQPHFSTKQHGEGSGLGLNICHTLITEFSGKIKILSTEHQGTKISLTFKLQE